jgi:hypothetical protein
MATIAFVCAIASSAAADPLETAKSAVDRSDYPAAKTALADALAAGENSPEQLAEIYRLSGIVTAALGDTQGATDAFERCLALAPKAALAPGTSPKITRPFAAAQAYFKAHERLEVKTETAMQPPAITVIVASDPLGMIAKVRVLVVADGKAEETLDRAASERTVVALPKGKRLDLRVIALDASGNHVAEVGSREVPIVVVGPGEPAEPAHVAPPVAKAAPTKPRAPEHARPLYLQWWLYGGAAIAFAGAGTYFGIDALRAKSQLDDFNAHSANHTFDQATSLESRARRSVLFTNIGLAAGGAFAVATTVLYVTRPRHAVERRLSITPAPGGAVVVVGGDL